MFYPSLSGIPALISHIITIGIIWLDVIIIARLVRRAFFKSAKTFSGDQEEKKEIIEDMSKVGDKVVKIIDIIATTASIIAILIFIFFQWSWQGRDSDEMDTIPKATADEDVIPTKEEIEKSNKESSDVEKSKEEKKDAIDDNNKAMNDALDMFKSIEDKQEKRKEDIKEVKE